MLRGIPDSSASGAGKMGETVKPETTTASAQWDEIRRLYRFYSGLNQRYAGLAAPQKAAPAENADPEAIARFQQWFAEIDKRVEAHQIREFLQTGFSLESDGLIALLARHLAAADRSEAHRDKLDFLLVQCLAQAIPPHAQNPDVQCAAEVLQPVLGDPGHFAWMDGLEACIRDLNDSRNLQEFMERRIFDRARELKAASGDVYFTAPAMLAFTRFNYVLRRGFIHLLRGELKTIRDALAQLETLGVGQVDCAAAGLSSVEPLKSLRALCRQWERPFQGKHSDQSWIHRVTQVRAAVAAAIEEAQRPKTAAAAPPAMPAAPPAPAAAAKAAALQATPAAPPKPAPAPAQTTSAAVATAKPAAAAGGPTAIPPLKTRLAAELERWEKHIAGQLRKEDPSKAAVLQVGRAKLSLIAWEVAAFQKAADAHAAALRRAATLRAMLAAAVGGASAWAPAAFDSLLQTAQSQLASLQQRAAQAEQAKDAHAADLAACARSLAAVLEQAKGLSKTKAPARKD